MTEANEAGDIRCHVCGERVNVRCWKCGTLRGGSVAAVEACTCDDEPFCPLHVGCDQRCRALSEPSPDDLSEVWAAYVHYRDHGWLSGCSHGC